MYDIVIDISSLIIFCFTLHGSYPAHAKHVLLYMTMVSYHIIFDVVYIVNLFDVQTGEFAHNIRAVQHCTDKYAMTYLTSSKQYLKNEVLYTQYSTLAIPIIIKMFCNQSTFCGGETYLIKELLLAAIHTAISGSKYSVVRKSSQMINAREMFALLRIDTKVSQHLHILSLSC